MFDEMPGNIIWIYCKKNIIKIVGLKYNASEKIILGFEELGEGNTKKYADHTTQFTVRGYKRTENVHYLTTFVRLELHT